MLTYKILLPILPLLPLFINGQQFVPGTLVRAIMDTETVGGINSIIDRSSKLDLKHEACLERAACEAVSRTRKVENDDGVLETVRETGLFRNVMDFTGNAIMKVTGLEEIKRRRISELQLERRDGAEIEYSLLDMLIDALDSAVIWGARVLTGRRNARQIEALAPVRSLVDTVAPILTPPKVSIYKEMVDFAVDVTGLYNRERGTYSYMRAGLLGYYQGENGVCEGLEGKNTCGNGAWSILTPLNKHKLGQIPGGKIRSRSTLVPYEPLLDEGLTISDLAKPKMLLCKVDTYLNLINTHMGSEDINAPYEDHEWITMDDAAVLELRMKMDPNTTELPGDKRQDEKPEDPVDTRLVGLDLTKARTRVLNNGSMEVWVKSVRKTEMDNFSSYCIDEAKKMKMGSLAKLKNETAQAIEDDDDVANGAIVWTNEDTKNLFNNSTNDDTEEEEKEEEEKSLEDMRLELELKMMEIEQQLREIEVEEKRQNEMKRRLEMEKENSKKAVPASTYLRSIVVDKMTDGVEGGVIVKSIFKAIKVSLNEDDYKIQNIREEGEEELLVELGSEEEREKVISAFKKYKNRSELGGRFRRPKLEHLKHLIAAARSL